MGNVLCKEPNTSGAPRTGNTFGNLSSVICPNGLGKGKAHPMRKTYFTRSAVDASKKTTSATGWQSVGLHVPSEGQKVIDKPPVAPPRKKRGATLDGRYRSDESLQVKNGFQDVFGRESRRHSCDIPPGTRPASVPPPRPETAALPARQTSCFEIDASNDAFSDFSKVPTTAELERTPTGTATIVSQIPRVGNRKSDKFFGERLADSLSTDEQRDTSGATKSDEKTSDKKRDDRKVDDVDRIEQFIEKSDEPEKKQPKPAVPVVERRKHAELSQKSAVVQAKEPGQSSELDSSKDVSGAQTKPGEEEDLMKYIDRTVSADNQIGRRAEFLMAMLEDYNDSVRYDGMQPIEEPLIVPKRRKSRHICDDHDHLHAKLHEHERDASRGETPEEPTLKPPTINVIRTEASIELAPRKPSRDFSKYKPIDPEPEEHLFDSEDEPGTKVARPARLKQKQREALPSPPAPPHTFQKSRSESQFDRHLSAEATSETPLKQTTADGEDTPPKAHTPRMLKRIISMPATEHLGREPAATGGTSRPPLTKSSSSGSFSAVDLQRTRISVERFTPEDFVHQGGADELVKPKSKLVTRKISWKATEPPNCRTPTPTPDSPVNPSFTIGGSAVFSTDGNTLVPPEVPRRKRSDASTELASSPTADEQDEEEEARKLSQAKLYQQLHSAPEDNSLRKFCLGSFIESSQLLQHHDVVNVLDHVYTATDNRENIIEQFQTFLENQLNAELDDPNTANPNVPKLLEKLSRVNNGSPVKPGDQDEALEHVKIDLVGSSGHSRSSSTTQSKLSDVDDCFDPEFEKIEKSEIVGELPKLEHHSPKTMAAAAGRAGRRRDSIEYMSDWFGGGDSDGSTTMLTAVGEDKDDGKGEKSQSLETVAVGRKGLHHPPSGRRESIEDVGRWFSNHSILRPSFGEEFEEPSRRLRRGSDGFLGYDQHRQYPFGHDRARSDSQSAELFEDITKLQEQNGQADANGVAPPERITIQPHQAQRKVLEHRKSSDALLMKVLHKPHLTLHSASTPTPKQGSVEKLNTVPLANETPVKPITESPTAVSSDENKPLLNPNEPTASTTSSSSSTSGKATASEENTATVALLNDAKGEPAGHRQEQEQHNEHSTLLKFLSKENLIE